MVGSPRPVLWIWPEVSIIGTNVGGVPGVLRIGSILAMIQGAMHLEATGTFVPEGLKPSAKLVAETVLVRCPQILAKNRGKALLLTVTAI